MFERGTKSMSEKGFNVNGTAVRTVICVLLIGASALVINNMQSSSSKFADEYAANEVTIADLNKEYKEVSDGKNNMSAETVEKTLKSASDRGNNVAYLQNNYRSLDVTVDQDAYVANAEALDPFFGDNDKNSRVEWYRVPDFSYKWTFKSNYDFSEDKIDVLWVCEHTLEENKTELLAYVTGVYDANTNTFSDINRVMTVRGMSYVPTTDDISTDTDVGSGSSSGSGSSKRTSSSPKAVASTIIDTDDFNETVKNLEEYYEENGIGGRTMQGNDPDSYDSDEVAAIVSRVKQENGVAED